MKRLLATVIVVLVLGAWTAIAERAEAVCGAPYGCVSSFNACKLPCNFIKHSNNGMHH